MQSEQTKSVNNGFCRSECAETRSNGSEACPRKQYDYVSRVGAEFKVQSAKCKVQSEPSPR